MNAHELADELENYVWMNPNNNRDYCKEVKDMLRQQADRIAELEKGGEVAGRFYWESVVDGHVMAVPSEGTPHYNKDDFPLYTAPRELSDEEIIEIGNAVVNLIDSNEGWIEFARAILKKASEK